MIRYAESSQCRMSSLVRHFGDLADGQRPCGICDFCAPAECVAQHFRPATEREETIARDIIDSLTMNGRSIGKLHAEMCPKSELSRDEFEELVAAMARAGYLRLTDAVFEKDGKSIPYRKASLTRDAEYLDEDEPLELSIRDTAPVTDKAKRKKKKAAPKPTAAAPAPEPSARTEELLRAWRIQLARKQSVPAFRIMSDKVLTAIARDRPKTAAELLAIPGIGIKAVEKYGVQIYRILNEARP